MNDVETAVLERMRRELEATDRELLALVARRADQVRDLWAWKREQGLPLFDKARESELCGRWLDWNRSAGLEAGALIRLFLALLDATAPASTPEDLRKRYPVTGVRRPGEHVRAPGTGGNEQHQESKSARAQHRNGLDRTCDCVTHIPGPARGTG